MTRAVLTLSAVVWALSGWPAAEYRQNSAAARLAEVQRAIGAGAQSVQAFRGNGTRIAGFNAITAKPVQSPQKLRLQFLLPDHYVMLTQSGSGPVNRRGFVRSTPIFGQQDSFEGGRTSSVEPDAAFLAEQRLRLAQLVLGMLGRVQVLPEIVPQAAEGREKLRIRVLPGEKEWSLELAGDGLPVRLQYTDAVQFPVPVSAAEVREGRATAPTWRTEQAEVVLTFEDHRVVSGLKIPHVIRRTANGVVFEELRFESIDINPPLTPSDFPR